MNRRNFLLTGAAFLLVPKPTMVQECAPTFDFGSGDFTISYWMKRVGNDWKFIEHIGNSKFVNGVLEEEASVALIDELRIRKTPLLLEKNHDPTSTTHPLLG